MKKNKKGFTLVELLAVIVVLIIIIFLAVNKIKGSSKKAKLNAIRANAISYIKLLKDKAGEDVIETEQLDSGVFTVSELANFGIQLSGKQPDSGLVMLSDFKVSGYCLKYGVYIVTNVDEENNIKKGSCSTDSLLAEKSFAKDFSYAKDNHYVFTAPTDSMYYIELWGASGGDGWASAGGASKCDAGKGAYTSGFVSLNKGTTLHIYVGGKGESGASGKTYKDGGYNGGGKGGYGGGDDNSGAGGGATDVRLVPGDSSNQASLASRIMVAAGGGGGSCINSSSDDISYRNAAGLNNPSITVASWNGTCASGAVSQTTGYEFGKGNDSHSVETGHGAAGGGGGYWGGTYCSGGSNFFSGGSGGTSYISGYTGSVAVSSQINISPKLGCSDGTTNNECSVHYSGYKFYNPKMISGDSSMPSYLSSESMKGNSGNGYARVTIVDASEIDQYEFAYTGTERTFVAPKEGKYKLQVWGAQGGYRSSSEYGGKGGYSEGIITLKKGDTLYIYVGGSGNTGGSSGGFNGGGSKQTYPGGGGATDIRIEGNTLYHRIIVAGGGGSDGAATYSGKAGGGLNGISATETNYCSGGEGATQTNAGLRGSFGKGGSGAYNSDGWGGGGFGGAGGGGWYGGGGVNPDRSDDDRGGGGGSGFIYDGTSSVPDGYAVSSHILTNGLTLDGNSSSIPTHDNLSTMTGNQGDGYAKITFMSNS